MPYAFLNPDGSIKQTFNKPTPFMRLGEGERMVNYNPPPVDDSLFTAIPETPVPEDTLDVTFTVEPLPDGVVWPVIRARRDALLAKSDWTQLPDVPLATKTAWAEYRQALRDITEQPNPTEIVWPEPPSSS
jgi:hypothetical protein